jgi:hypothetical protein
MRYALIVGGLVAVLTAAAPAGAQGTGAWHKGTALALFGGAATASGGSGGAAGASIAWELTPVFTIEGASLWTRGDADKTFVALAGTRVNLMPRRTLVPFASAGVGVHRLLDPAIDNVVSAVGGGVEVFLTQHLSVRPDVRALFVRGDDDTRVTGVYGVHLSYHFEDHPITPVVR